MKKYLLIAIGLLMAGLMLAQKPAYDWRDYRHMVIVSYGSPSLVDGMVDGLVWLFTWGQEETAKSTGQIGVQYGYNALKWLRVGGRFSYLGSYYPGYEPYTHSCKVSGRVDFTYLNRRYVMLYSGVELGVGINYNVYKTSFDDNFIKPSLVVGVTPIGIQVGGSHVFGMAELGIGSIEIIRAGIGIRF